MFYGNWNSGIWIFFRQIERILALRTLQVNKVSRFFTEIGISEFGFFRQIERSLALGRFNVNKVSRIIS